MNITLKISEEQWEALEAWIDAKIDAVLEARGDTGSRVARHRESTCRTWAFEALVEVDES